MKEVSMRVNPWCNIRRKIEDYMDANYENPFSSSDVFVLPDEVKRDLAKLGDAVANPVKARVLELNPELCYEEVCK